MIVSGKEDLSGPVLGNLNERLGTIDYVICHSDSFSHMRSLKKRMDEWSKPTIVSGCFMYSSSEKKLEILNDHYKDTFSHLVGYRKQRDRLLLYQFGVMAILILYQLFPGDTINAVLKIISKKVGVDIALSTIGGLFLVYMPILVFLIILRFRYWQVRNIIESHYGYIEKLEQELASLFPSGVPFTRESNFSYKGQIHSIWNQRFYNLLFHMSLNVWILLSLTYGWRHDGFSWSRFISVIVYIIFYSYWNRTTLKQIWKNYR